MAGSHLPPRTRNPRTAPGRDSAWRMRLAETRRSQPLVAGTDNDGPPSQPSRYCDDSVARLASSCAFPWLICCSCFFPAAAGFLCFIFGIPVARSASSWALP